MSLGSCEAVERWSSEAVRQWSGTVVMLWGTAGSRGAVGQGDSRAVS